MKLTEIVKNFGKAKVAVIGDFNVDALVYGKHTGFSRESAAPILGVNDINYHPGAAANLAANLLSLGVGLLCPIGTVGNLKYNGVTLDVGDFLWNYFNNNQKVQNELIKCDRPTYTYLKILAKGEGTSTSSQQWYRIDMGTKTPLTEDLEIKVSVGLDYAMKNCDILIVSDYGKGLITEKILAHINENYKNKIKIGTARKEAYKLYGFDIIALNDYETIKSDWIPIEVDENERVKDDLLIEYAGALLHKTKARNLVVSRGANGISLFNEVIDSNPLILNSTFGRNTVTEHIHIPTKPKEVVDITGAGDSTLAAIVAALGAGAELADAARIGNYAGGLAIQKPGTATITQEELIVEIENDKR